MKLKRKARERAGQVLLNYVGALHEEDRVPGRLGLVVGQQGLGDGEERMKFTSAFDLCQARAHSPG